MARSAVESLIAGRVVVGTGSTVGGMVGRVEGTPGGGAPVGMPAHQSNGSDAMM